MLTYQALLQNEMFGTQIDCLYDEQHMGSSYSNVNSNNQHATGVPNQTGGNDTTNPGGAAAAIGQGLAAQIHTTAISGLNVRTASCA